MTDEAAKIQLIPLSGIVTASLEENGPMANDSDLLRIVDNALREVAARSGAWLVCKPGCSACCVGVFAIHALDAMRLRAGLADLLQRDPDRAARIVQRVADSISRLSKDFPGNPDTGILDENAESEAAFEDFANNEPCPVLDPATGTCDLYASRPMTCRVFGPPVRSEGGLGVCELCYDGASEDEIAACELVPDPSGLEGELLAKLTDQEFRNGSTIVAYALGIAGERLHSGRENAMQSSSAEIDGGRAAYP